LAHSDEEFARALQEAEEATLRYAPSNGEENHISDAEFARRLQAEENASTHGFYRSSHPGGRSGQQLPELINGFMGSLFSGGSGNASQSGNFPAGSDPQASVRGLMNGFTQMASGLQQMQAAQTRRSSGAVR